METNGQSQLLRFLLCVCRLVAVLLEEGMMLREVLHVYTQRGSVLAFRWLVDVASQ